MNTKTFILIGLCLLGPWAGDIPANNPKTTNFIQINNDVPHGYEEIELRGSLVLNPGLNPIEAGVNDNSIYIQFNKNFGNVTVNVYNPNGLTVYSSVVNTAVQQLLVIPITGLVDGVYTVVLENATGYADGEFEKNND